MKIFRFSLTFAILASLSCLLVLTWLLLSLISFKTSEKDLLAQKSEAGRLLLATFIHLLPEGFGPEENPGPAQRLALRLASEKSFSGIIVIGRDGRELYRIADSKGVDGKLGEVLRTGTETAVLTGDGRFISRYAPIREKGEIVAAARMTLSLAPEYARLNQSIHIFMAYFVLDFLLLLGFGSYLLSRCIVLPIKRLLASTGKIAAGDLSCRVKVPGNAEIAALAESFNSMVDALRKKRDEVETHIKSLERINRELQFAREESIRSEKMASVGLLAAGTAHEIGTPLASIMGYAGLLRDENGDSPEKADYLARIEEEAGRIDRIVRGLLDYARPSRTEPEEVDVVDLLQSTIDMLDRQGVFRNIEISLSEGSSVPRPDTDRHQLQQVFTNLFINARDAMPNGGTLDVRVLMGGQATAAGQVQPSSVIRGRRRDDFSKAFSAQVIPHEGNRYLCIQVSDTGVGIEPENLERVFDPFFTTKEPGKGTGLGLAVTARIVDSLGGRITVESIPSAGSTFTVWLPFGTEENSNP
ncbi:MAG: HAMP domain-containing protein [Deltaproteobacteria bacterium]|nr:HAMP domain-containing protein [Deltaproteobacteria bacterium]